MTTRWYRAAISTCLLKCFQVNSLGCYTAGFRIPIAVVGTQPLQHPQVASTSCCIACAPMPVTTIRTQPLQHFQVTSSSCCIACARIPGTVVGTGILVHCSTSKWPPPAIAAMCKNPSHSLSHVPTAAPASGLHQLLHCMYSNASHRHWHVVVGFTLVRVIDHLLKQPTLLSRLLSRLLFEDAAISLLFRFLRRSELAKQRGQS